MARRGDFACICYRFFYRDNSNAIRRGLARAASIFGGQANAPAGGFILGYLVTSDGGSGSGSALRRIETKRQQALFDKASLSSA